MRSLTLWIMAATPALGQDGVSTQLADLRARLDAIAGSSDSVDLSGDEHASIYEATGGVRYDDVVTRPWYQRLDIWGYAAAGYLDTGGVGTRPDGGFLVNEATLFFEGQASDRMSVFVELFLTRWAFDNDEDLHTGEVYLDRRGLGASESSDGVRVKLGRFDIPFGGEYVWDDATEDPLISSSAAWPYGFDEGVLASGRVGYVGWVAAVMDGSVERSINTDAAQSVAVKLYGEPTESLYVSASMMPVGDAPQSGIKFGKHPIQPVGLDAPSTQGDSTSDTVEAFLWEVDAIYEPSSQLELSLNYGANSISDDDANFDRDFSWFLVQPRVKISDNVYAVVRYSEIGTREDDEGYIFDGKIISKGRLLGYDTKLLQRLSAGIGWEINPDALFKVEVGQDWFDLIDGSPFREENSKRTFFGFQVVLSF
ncbi:MAG: hypothetical protein GY711_00925 [bacterium]|nr:hypothetical protein [bacterium]